MEYCDRIRKETWTEGDFSNIEERLNRLAQVLSTMVITSDNNPNYRQFSFRYDGDKTKPTKRDGNPDPSVKNVLQLSFKNGALHIEGNGQINYGSVPYEYTKAKKVVIHEGASIGDHAFIGFESLSSVSILGPVRSIGMGAFKNCRALSIVSMPDSLESIGDSAFEGCSELHVDIPTHVRIIGQKAFKGCSSLLSVTMPDSVESIGDHAFSGCSALSSVSLPHTMKSIGRGAFSGCSALSSVSLPRNIEIMEDLGFTDCKWFENPSIEYLTIGDVDWHLNADAFKQPGTYRIDDGVLLSSDRKAIIRFPEGRKGDYAVPNSVEVINSHAFDGCSLNTVSFPRNVEKIDDGAFIDCNLEHVSAGDASWLLNVHILRHSGTCCINDGVLFSHDKKTLINFPKGREGDYTVPDSVEVINSHAFEGCSLSSLTIGFVKSIGGFAFSFCSLLSSVTMPDKVEFIGDNAFSGCIRLGFFNIERTEWILDAGGLKESGKYRIEDGILM